MRAPTLRRKLALTAKVQDEVGHAQLLYRVAEDLGKPREAMFAGPARRQDQVPQRLPLPDASWGDVGIIAWLVDAAAIVAQQALRDSSYGPYARTMKKICWEESVHIMHGRDVVVTLMNGTAGAARPGPGGARPLVGPADADARPAHRPRERTATCYWRIKAKTGEELRQEFLAIYVPRSASWACSSPIRTLHARRGRRRSGATPSPTGRSCAPSSPATARARRSASSSGGSTSEETAWVRQTILGARPRRPLSRTAAMPARRKPRMEPYEVFRQEKDGDPMRHGGNVMAPDPELALHYAREMYSRRNESTRLWVVRRADISVLDDPDLLQPPLDRSFKKPGGYVMRDKLDAAARARQAEAGASSATPGRRPTRGADEPGPAALRRLGRWSRACSARLGRAAADDGRRRVRHRLPRLRVDRHRAAARGGRRLQLDRPGRDRPRAGAVRAAAAS